MTGIEFGELPPSTAGGTSTGHWERVADELRARPGEWAKVKETVSRNAAWSTAGNIRSGLLRGFRRGEFEAVSRNGAVWARYVGGAS